MDDLIGRQAAIEVADAVWTVTGDKNVAKVWQQLKDLPSAERRGRWIFDLDNKEWSWNKPYVCDQCGKWNERSSNYCPNCGAQMDEKEGENATD